jgi:hypothetical protein
MGWNAEDLVKRIEDAAERRYMSDSLEPEITISPEERAWRTRLESLRLSHTRILEQLKRATNPAHREVLLRALRHLEVVEMSLHRAVVYSDNTDESRFTSDASTAPYQAPLPTRR